MKEDNGFIIRVSGRDVMDKLNKIEDQLIKGHEIMKNNRTSMMTNRKLIYGCYGFTFAALIMAIVLKMAIN